MITSDNAKTIVIIGGALAIAYGVYSLQKRAEKFGGSLWNAAESAAHDADVAVSQGIRTVRNAIADSTGIISRDNSSDTNPDYVAPEYVVELPFSKWPQSIKDNINILNRTRGITRVWKYEGDFSGWKVFSNGTVISPEGYYASDNSFNEANQYDEGIMVIPDSFTGKTFDQTRYQWQEQ